MNAWMESDQKKKLNYTIILWVMIFYNKSFFSSFSSKSHGIQRAHIFMFFRWASAVGCFLHSVAWPSRSSCYVIFQTTFAFSSLLSLLLAFQICVLTLEESKQWAKPGMQEKMLGSRSANGRSRHCPYTSLLGHCQCHLWSQQPPALGHRRTPRFLITEVHICQVDIWGSSGSVFFLSCFYPILPSLPTLALLCPSYLRKCKGQRRFPKPSSLTHQFESKPVPFSISFRAFVSMSSLALSMF